ncbi:glycoside hydrolase family 9 protein, partial [Roseateles sp. BYS96W]
DLGIPESGNGLPDLLDEIKWELEFIKRMQDATGTDGLFLKIGVDTYSGGSSPLSSDTRPRYYLPECTSATLAGAAMLASAAVVYRGVASQADYGADL